MQHCTIDDFSSSIHSKQGLKKHYCDTDHTKHTVVAKSHVKSLFFFILITLQAYLNHQIMRKIFVYLYIF